MSHAARQPAAWLRLRFEYFRRFHVSPRFQYLPFRNDRFWPAEIDTIKQALRPITSGSITITPSSWDQFQPLEDLVDFKPDGLSRSVPVVAVHQQRAGHSGEDQ